MRHKVLISACLMGENVRYDGNHNLISHPILKSLHQHKQLIIACPEVLGGLAVPRPPAEIIKHTPYVIKTLKNEDVTQQFLQGAKKTLALCQTHNVHIALMAAKSPSCGNEETYNGQFNKTLVKQAGVTANLLQKNGILVFNQYQLDSFFKSLHNSD